MASKGFTGAATRTCRVDIPNPSSSSRTMSNRARPNTCVSSSNSESNRRTSVLKSLQSSWRTQRQYISTNGRSFVQVERIAWREGAERPTCRRHTSWPAWSGTTEGILNRMHTTFTRNGQQQQEHRECKQKGGGLNTYPALSRGTGARALLNSSNTRSKKIYSLPKNPPHCNDRAKGPHRRRQQSTRSSMSWNACK